MLPPEEGYRVALQNLKTLFGEEHRVMKSLLENLKAEIKSIKNDPMSWQLIAVRLKDCKLTFNYMGKVDHLSSFETLDSIIKCFSMEIRDKWVERNVELKAKGQIANYDDLIELIEDQANYRSNIFSHLSMSQDKVFERAIRDVGKRNIFVTINKSIDYKLSAHSAIKTISWLNVRNFVPHQLAID